MKKNTIAITILLLVVIIAMVLAQTVQAKEDTQTGIALKITDFTTTTTYLIIVLLLIASKNLPKQIKTTINWFAASITVMLLIHILHFLIELNIPIPNDHEITHALLVIAFLFIIIMTTQIKKITEEFGFEKSQKEKQK